MNTLCCNTPFQLTASFWKILKISSSEISDQIFEHPKFSRMANFYFHRVC